MPANSEFQSLLRDLITDVQEASVLWQIAVLVASLGLAWLFERQFLRSGLNREIWVEFGKNGVSIPFPQREVRVLGASE